MMTSFIPRVNDTYFQHPVLTRIHGPPAYGTLQVIFSELKANASSVPSTLGGGQHGHLGLVLPEAKYLQLPNTAPWVTPLNPPAFVPPEGATGPQIAAAKEQWQEEKATFVLCQATERALIALLVAAVDNVYIQALQDRITGQYSTSILQMLDHLWDTYVTVTHQQVQE